MTSRYLDPTNDVAFKKLFSKKERLIDLLNAVLKLPQGMQINELDYIPTEQMPLFIDGKRSIFDLKVKDESGRWYIIEMQRKVEKDYIDRVQFYGSYSYVNQIEQGLKHKDLLPIIVISIIGSNVFSTELPCINYHHFTETSTKKQYLFSLTYVFIELGKFDESKIVNNTDQWLHLLKCAHKEQQPPKEINNNKILSAYEDLEQYRWSQLEHDAYIRSKLAMEAEETAFETKYEEGFSKGIEKAIEKVAISMIKQGVDVRIITQTTGLTEQEVQKLKAKL